MNAIDPTVYSSTFQSVSTSDWEAERKFSELLRQLDAGLAQLEKSVEEKRREEEAEEAKKTKERKLQELRDMIARLQARVSAGDANAAGQLSVLQNELLMMMIFG